MSAQCATVRCHMTTGLRECHCCHVLIYRFLLDGFPPFGATTDITAFIFDLCFRWVEEEGVGVCPTGVLGRQGIGVPG